MPDSADNLPLSIEWDWRRMGDLSSIELHRILCARATVFVVEQNCPYQDRDEYDLRAWHLTGWTATGVERDIAAYLRVVDPGAKYAEVAFGRILTTKRYRGMGLGRALIAEALKRITEIYGARAVRISAQQYLEDFYRSFGFATVSQPYLEDGIPHLDMLKEKG
jgi:ElaA protein